MSLECCECPDRSPCDVRQQELSRVQTGPDMSLLWTILAWKATIQGWLAVSLLAHSGQNFPQSEIRLQDGCSWSCAGKGWIPAWHRLHEQGWPRRPLQEALRPVLLRLRREVRRGVPGQEERHGDPQSGDGDQRVPWNLQDPQAEEGKDYFFWFQLDLQYSNVLTSPVKWEKINTKTCCRLTSSRWWRERRKRRSKPLMATSCLTVFSQPAQVTHLQDTIYFIF